MPDPSPKKQSQREVEPLVCKCGHILGQSYYVDDVFAMALCGGFMIDESAHGRCVNCGRGVHIVIPLKSLRKLLSHYDIEVKQISLEITEKAEGT